jgi:hypothetical protein
MDSHTRMIVLIRLLISVVICNVEGQSGGPTSDIRIRLLLLMNCSQCPCQALLLAERKEKKVWKCGDEGVSSSEH